MVPLAQLRSPGSVPIGYIYVLYSTDAIDSIPIETIRKFAARSQRYVNAYASGKTSSGAIEWATK
ncbi:hypothetical protein RSAG8_10938, partial [Rhizoctonia solani AG-8 WAC10335]